MNTLGGAVSKVHTSTHHSMHHYDYGIAAPVCQCGAFLNETSKWIKPKKKLNEQPPIGYEGE